MVPFTIFTIIFFGVTTYISLDVGFGVTDVIGGVSDPPERLRSIALFVLTSIWPAACVLFLYLYLFLSYSSAGLLATFETYAPFRRVVDVWGRSRWSGPGAGCSVSRLSFHHHSDFGPCRSSPTLSSVPHSSFPHCSLHPPSSFANPKPPNQALKIT